MSAFSTIGSGTSLQDIALINELLTAYNELRGVFSETPVSASLSEQNIQDSAFWRGMQVWVEQHYESFVDDQAEIAGGTSIPMLTEELFMERSEMTASGWWRKAVDSYPEDWTDYGDDAFLDNYGQCVADDIIGPWLWVDLQKAFVVMKWTTVGINQYSANVTVQSRMKVYFTAAAESLSVHDSQWMALTDGPDGDGWVEIDDPYSMWYGIPYIAEANGGTGPDDYSSHRNASSFTLQGIADHIECSIDIYASAVNAGSGTTFRDIDAIGLSQDVLNLIFSLESASSSSRSTGYFLPSGTTLLGQLHSPCYVSNVPVDEIYFVSVVVPLQWIFKWDFTYT
jgi:hypothetical protein